MGGNKEDKIASGIQTRDGDYVIVGHTFSFGKGKSDAFVAKLDGKGNERWRKYLGSSDHDRFNDVVETSTGNLILVGATQDPTTQDADGWVVALDGESKMLWSKKFGGKFGDELESVILTSDNGLAALGYTASQGNGKSDIWLLRLDLEGEMLWQKEYGGKEMDRGSDLIEIDGADLLFCGYTQSYGNGKSDMVVVRTNFEGKGKWKQNLGGELHDVAESLCATGNDTYLIAGWSQSPTNADQNACLFALNGKGTKLWSQTYGGMGKDAFLDLVPSKVQGAVLTGYSAGKEEGLRDLWLQQVDERGKVLWSRKSEGANVEEGVSLAARSEGGWAVFGNAETNSAGESDSWILATDRNGYFAPVPQGGWVDPAQTVSREQEANRKPNLYMLSIGVSNYQVPDISLEFAHADAHSLAERFLQMKDRLFGTVEVQELVNEKATLSNIKKAVSVLERSATQKDLILVFISSHGALDNKGNLYIVPYDFSPQNLFATGFDIEDLTAGMNGTPCKKLILLDACHSGQSALDLLDLRSAKSLDVNDAVKELLQSETGVTIMTSSSGREFSYENPAWGHGAFTKALLEGLEGQADYNQNKVITLSELNLFVSDRVKILTEGRQHPYTPINLFGNIPLFVLE